MLRLLASGGLATYFPDEFVLGREVFEEPSGPLREAMHKRAGGDGARYPHWSKGEALREIILPRIGGCAEGLLLVDDDVHHTHDVQVHKVQKVSKVAGLEGAKPTHEHTRGHA